MDHNKYTNGYYLTRRLGSRKEREDPKADKVSFSSNPNCMRVKLKAQVVLYKNIQNYGISHHLIREVFKLQWDTLNNSNYSYNYFLQIVQTAAIFIVISNYRYIVQTNNIDISKNRYRRLYTIFALGLAQNGREQSVNRRSLREQFI